ncbi:hypothetical protein PHET_08179, partial [Paragonimus heterotremus]
RVDPGLTDFRSNVHGQTSAIKDLYRRLDQLNEKSRRQYNDLQKEVQTEKDRLGQFNENLHKTVDSRSTELKRQFAILHNEMVGLQLRLSKQPEDIVKTNEQPQEIRKLAESLLAVKLALAMKIRLLEKKVSDSHHGPSDFHS